MGLLTTRGFRDVLAIGREARPRSTTSSTRRPSRSCRATSGARLPSERPRTDRSSSRSRSTRSTASSSCSCGTASKRLRVCFLHSYANPAHERSAVERIRARHPDLSVTASSEVATEWREFERTSTTVLNSYIQPPFATYLGELGDRLRGAGYTRPFALMQSNGGVIDASRASRLPIRTLESGPAGGVIGARALAAELGYANVICADVGGTSYDVALIEDGDILERTDTKVGGRPVVGPGIDIVSIGAGGGSIAWIDHRGAVKVGPQSAGAHPGPACFGLGGEEPTVTDCHLVLGRLDPENFLGSRMQLDVDAAQHAIQSRIADPIGATLEQAADGILSIAETNMTYAIRAITVERGLDPREFALFSYGGGGGLFAAATAEELEIPTVVVPRAPANFSAWGILTSDYRDDAALTRVRAFDEGSIGGLVADLRMLAERATTELRAYGFDEAELEHHYRTDARLRRAGAHDHRSARERMGRRRAGTARAGLRERFVVVAPPALRPWRTGSAARSGHRPLPRRCARRAADVFRSGRATEQAEPVRSRIGLLPGRRRLRPDAGLRPRAGGARPGDRRPGDRRGVDDDDRRPAELARARRPARRPRPRERTEPMTTAPAPAAVDVVTAEIVRNGLTSAALEMNKTLVRTAYNPLLYEVQDFGLGLVSAEGLLWAEAPRSHGLPRRDAGHHQDRHREVGPGLRRGRRAHRERSVPHRDAHLRHVGLCAGLPRRRARGVRDR